MITASMKQKPKRSSPKIIRYVPGLIIMALLGYLNYSPLTIIDNSVYEMRLGDTAIVNFERNPTLTPERSHLHIGSKAMVSCDVEKCSKMGKDILLRGGNAADAAVTVALCIGSINSASSGIGGGGFITSSHNETGNIISVDAREMAPGKAFEDMYVKDPMLAVIGGLSNGIPGELKGLDELYKRHGSGNLTWYELFEPVIEMNRNGFECTFVVALFIDVLRTRYFPLFPEVLANWDFIYNEDGTFKKQGDIITRPAFANTLELIAKNGSSDIFYDPNGPIVKNLIKANNKFGGVFTKSDFVKYEALVEDTLNLTLSDELQVFTSSGVSSGLVLLSGLNVFQKLHDSNDSNVTVVHKIIETMRWMASVRTRLGNGNKDYAEHIRYYTSDEFARDVIENKYSDNQTFGWEHYDPLFEMVEPHGTSHFSILDENDNAVGMTTTVNLLFGSLVYDPITGIILNNEMDDFSTKSFNNSFNLEPSKFNLVRPYTRPLSSTAPTIIMKNGKPDLLIGAAGGSRITTAIFQAIIRIYYLNYPLLESIAYPRIHDQLMPDYIFSEDIDMLAQEFNDPKLIEQLTELGHNFKLTGVETAMNAIQRVCNATDTEIQGVGDFWRKFAEADGY